MCLTSVNARYILGRVVEGMNRPRHPDKHIEKAIQYAESLSWRVELSNGHAWVRLFCRHSTREGCTIVVWSTPRCAENHARHIRRKVDRCSHPLNGPGRSEEGGEHGAQGRM